MMKRLLCAALALIMILTTSSCRISSPKEYEINDAAAGLIVHFLEVGQGDCTLLESDGEFVLIDAGEKEYGDSIVRYIEGRNAPSLKYVIATHPHSDHIGGMTEVINHVDTENFITSETDQSTRTWRNVLQAVDEHDVNYIDARPGDTYSFGRAEFTVLAPLSDQYSGYNNYSVVTKVEYGDVSFLLTGDAEKQSEKEMLQAGFDLSADVLKCGHHGSSTSSTANFLKAVRPSYAVISCGKNNEYGHPHKETLQKLELLGCRYFRTDELGTIVAYTDGKGLHFSTDEGEIQSATVSQSTLSPEATDSYIGNKNSKVFHLPSCSGAANMKETNKVFFSTREAAVEAGYSPCSLCQP